VICGLTKLSRGMMLPSGSLRIAEAQAVDA
jgi:hypothetical protein